MKVTDWHASALQELRDLGYEFGTFEEAMDPARRAFTMDRTGASST
jgi:hypothetical protein